jgi:hypothetical protein
MATIPNNYPSGCSDEQIFQVINELSGEIISSGGNINEVLRSSPLISLGQAEIQKRILANNQSVTTELNAEVKRLTKISEENAKSAEKYSRASKIFSIAALIIALISVVISIFFSTQSNQTNLKWQKEQSNLLQKILEK